MHARRWSPDRETGFALAVLLPIFLAAVSWSYAFEHDIWRRDVMQAADRAGLYLFFLSPCYAAVSAWAAVRSQSLLGDVMHGLPAPSLVWRRSWRVYAAAGMAAHVIVIALMVTTAMLSDAIGTVSLLPLVVQLLSIPFFAALGALAGGLVRSRLTPPVLLLGLLACNTILIQYGFRRISEVGTGAADFIDLSLRTGYLLPKAALFAGLCAFAWPLRSWALGPLKAARSLTAAVSAALFLWVFTAGGQPQVYRPSTPVCHTAAGTQVCVPRALADRAEVFDAPVARVVAMIEAIGVRSVPNRVEVVSRGAMKLRRGSVIVTVTATDVVSRRSVQRAVDFGFAYAQACEDPTSTAGPPDGVLITHAQLDGWLQHETGAVEPGSFPRESLEALLALPAEERTDVLRRLFDAVWACDRTVQPFGGTG